MEVIAGFRDVGSYLGRGRDLAAPPRRTVKRPRGHEAIRPRGTTAGPATVGAGAAGQQLRGRGRLGRAAGEEARPGRDPGHRLGRGTLRGGTVHVVCAVSSCSRFRFVRFASDDGVVGAGLRVQARPARLRRLLRSRWTGCRERRGERQHEPCPLCGRRPQWAVDVVWNEGARTWRTR
jgi:hypothetical protein